MTAATIHGGVQMVCSQSVTWENSKSLRGKKQSNGGIETKSLGQSAEEGGYERLWMRKVARARWEKLHKT